MNGRAYNREVHLYRQPGFSYAQLARSEGSQGSRLSRAYAFVQEGLGIAGPHKAWKDAVLGPRLRRLPEPITIVMCFAFNTLILSQETI
jgi:hypothetical protein